MCILDSNATILMRVADSIAKTIKEFVVINIALEVVCVVSDECSMQTGWSMCFIDNEISLVVIRVAPILVIAC